MRVLTAPSHQRAALPLHKLTMVIFGLLALVSISGGIVAIVFNAKSKTELAMFGVTFTTGHVGVALVGIGLITTFFTFRVILRNQHDLARLPEVYDHVDRVKSDEFGVLPVDFDDKLGDAVANRVHLPVAHGCGPCLILVGANFYNHNYPFSWEAFRNVAGQLRLSARSLPVVIISRAAGIQVPELLRNDSPIPHFELTVSPDCSSRDIANAWLDLLSVNNVYSEGYFACPWFPKGIRVKPSELSEKARRFLHLDDSESPQGEDEEPLIRG
jgi:hypothetical protein